MITPPEPLTDKHKVEGFESGEPSLDEWLKHNALRNQHGGSSRTYVVCEGCDIIGYYCLAAGAVGRSEAPKAIQRNRPDPLPVLVLGRLAIHKDHQQQGIGTALVRDAILRTLQASELAGVSALLVHSLSENAKRFYLSRGFIESPIKPMTLFLPLGTVRRALKEE
jgi:GNAT superfamily N-acetyltransferase